MLRCVRVAARWIACAAIVLLSYSAFAAAVPTDYQPNYDDGYGAGYPVGYKSGFTTGTERGTSEGKSQGNSDGYNVGWNETYPPAYDRAYAVRYPVGLGEGKLQGAHLGYEEGLSYSQELAEAIFGSASFGSIRSSISLSGRGLINGHGGGSSETFVSFVDISNRYVDPEYDWGKHYYDLGYTDGVGTGTKEGDQAGYAKAYPPAYDAGYKSGYVDGSARGARHGEIDGGTAGFDAGWGIGWDEGYDLGFDYGVNIGVAYHLGLLDGYAWAPAIFDDLVGAPDGGNRAVATPEPAGGAVSHWTRAWDYPAQAAPLARLHAERVFNRRPRHKARPPVLAA